VRVGCGSAFNTRGASTVNCGTGWLSLLAITRQCYMKSKRLDIDYPMPC
jgi:hypothetical protein